MKLFKTKEINKQEIAIQFECGLSKEELSDFRKAVDMYRKGDELQLEYYEKGNRIIAGAQDNLDLAMEGIE